MSVAVEPKPFIPPSELNTVQKVLRTAVVVVALAAIALSAASFAGLGFAIITPFAAYIAVCGFATIALVAQHAILNKRIVIRDKLIHMHEDKIKLYQDSQCQIIGKLDQVLVNAQVTKDRVI